jgi:Zn-finger nucleic acid-binding protein
VCEIPLWVASFDGRYRGYACTKCRGTLFERDTFINALTELRTWAGGPPVPPQPFDADELKRKVRCPLCKQVMQTHPYYGPGVFAIDSCVNCDAVWLDYGELKEAVEAPGRNRGIGLRKAEITDARDGPIQLEPFGGSMNLIIGLGELFKKLPF